VFVDPGAPQRDAIEEAAKWILEGGVVAIPTDTLYGLAANPFSPEAVARVFAVKGRESERALPLIAADAEQAAAQLGRLSDVGQRLAERYWPGPPARSVGWPAHRSPRPAPTSAASGRRPIRPTWNERWGRASIC
jgi:tRNA A37 threonylcarbamoyladenosine synthetase subunit TsaC/SUA5/YrdC